jgi:hypothetical protein
MLSFLGNYRILSLKKKILEIMGKFYLYLSILMIFGVISCSKRSTEPYNGLNQNFPKPKPQRVFWIEVNDKKMAISEGVVSVIHLNDEILLSKIEKNEIRFKLYQKSDIPNLNKLSCDIVKSLWINKVPGAEASVSFDNLHKIKIGKYDLSIRDTVMNVLPGCCVCRDRTACCPGGGECMGCSTCGVCCRLPGQ